MFQNVSKCFKNFWWWRSLISIKNQYWFNRLLLCYNELILFMFTYIWKTRGGGVAKVSPNITWGGGGVDQSDNFLWFLTLNLPILTGCGRPMPLDALTHLFHQFVLVFLLVNVNKSCFVLKEKMSCYTGGGGGGGLRNVTKCHQGGGGGLKSVKKVSRIIWMAPCHRSAVPNLFLDRATIWA
jgi:hypothetical protein